MLIALDLPIAVVMLLPPIIRPSLPLEMTLGFAVVGAGVGAGVGASVAKSQRKKAVKQSKGKLSL